MPCIRANDPEPLLARDIADFVRSGAFPCAGAKSALSLGSLETAEGGDFDRAADYTALRRRLIALGLRVQAGSASDPLCSLLWAFAPGPILTEADFEHHLWRHIQALHDLDTVSGCPWASGVSDDPGSENFSMSLAGHAYFIVGLHPGGPRAARRFSRPLIAFNSHIQFERLRADGRYDRMHYIIRHRDRTANGDVNPMLGNHGRKPQAPQFSGRIVSPDWNCPLKIRMPR